MALAALLLVTGGCRRASQDVEAEMREQLRTTEGIEVESLECVPDGRLGKGDRATCTARIGGVTLEYDLVFVSDRRFRADPRTTVIKKGDLEQRLADQQKVATSLEVTVDCGPRPIYDAAALVGARCRATSAEITYELVITVEDRAFTGRPTQPLVFKEDAEQILRSWLVTQGIADATVACGTAPVVSVPPGGTLTCDVRTPDGIHRTAVLGVDDESRIGVNQLG